MAEIGMGELGENTFISWECRSELSQMEFGPYLWSRVLFKIHVVNIHIVRCLTLCGWAIQLSNEWVGTCVGLTDK